jgi:hypothetical protein
MFTKLRDQQKPSKWIPCSKCEFRRTLGSAEVCMITPPQMVMLNDSIKSRYPAITPNGGCGLGVEF